MQSKFNKQDVVIYKPNKLSDYGVVQDKKLINRTGMILSSYYLYKVKFSTPNGIMLTKWVKEDEIGKHPELEFGNQLCNICAVGKRHEWKYGIPSCKPTCEFRSDDCLDDDFGEDDNCDESSKIICDHCGKEYDCAEYCFCPNCFEHDGEHYSVDNKHRYLKVYYDAMDLEIYKNSQILGLRARRAIISNFKEFKKPSVTETAIFRIYRQVYIKRCKDIDIWGEIDRIILKSTNELLRDRISIHSVKKEGGHVLYNGFNMLLTDNKNETEYQIDGPKTRLSILMGFEREKYEKEREENQKRIPPYIG